MPRHRRPQPFNGTLAVMQAVCAFMQQHGIAPADVAAVITGGHRRWADEDAEPGRVTFVEREHARRKRQADAALVLDVDRSLSTGVYTVVGIANETGAVHGPTLPPSMTEHARERMAQRQITTHDVRRVLADGVRMRGRNGTVRFRLTEVKDPDEERQPQLVVVASEDHRVITAYFDTAHSTQRPAVSRNMMRYLLYARRQEGKQKDLRRERWQCRGPRPCAHQS